jgi:hypothetical protein
MKANLNEIWELIDNLTLEEKKIIYKRMEKEINSKLLYLLDKINERSENDAVPLEDITKEVEEVRGKRYGEN